MDAFISFIKQAKEENKTLFYNTEGLKLAYQLGVKHLSSAEHLGFGSLLPNGDLLVQKKFLLVDFEKKEIISIEQGNRLKVIPLKPC